MLERDILHPLEARDPQAVSFRKLPPELLRINLDRAPSAKRAKPQEPAGHTAREGAFPRIVQLHHALLHHNVFFPPPQWRIEPARLALPAGKGRRNGRVSLNASRERKSYLTRKHFWVNCIFL